MTLEDIRKLCNRLPLPPPGTVYSEPWLEDVAMVAKILPKLLAVVETAEDFAESFNYVRERVTHEHRKLLDALAALEKP